jgi:hypothetical protein
LVGIPGAIIIVNQSFGGSVDTLLSTFVFVCLVYSALALGTYNIWKLQLDQHRKWMLRAIIWMGVIITQRVWMITLALFLPVGRHQVVSIACSYLPFLFAGLCYV